MSELRIALVVEGVTDAVIIECSLDLERRLRGLPKAERVKKHTLDYRDHSQRITDAWASVCEQCSQAERFSLDVIARMPSTQ